MCFISLNKEKSRLFFMYCLSVYLIQIQSYCAFSNMAVDHWCLSLKALINKGGKSQDGGFVGIHKRQ